MIAQQADNIKIEDITIVSEGGAGDILGAGQEYQGDKEMRGGLGDSRRGSRRPQQVLSTVAWMMKVHHPSFRPRYPRPPPHSTEAESQTAVLVWYPWVAVSKCEIHADEGLLGELLLLGCGKFLGDRRHEIIGGRNECRIATATD